MILAQNPQQQLSGNKFPFGVVKPQTATISKLNKEKI